MPFAEAELKLDIFADYDLTQAFLRLGERLYGAQWSGNFRELSIRRKPSDPTAIAEKLEQLKIHEKEISALIDAEKSKIAKTTDPAIIDASTVKIGGLQRELSVIHQNQMNMPTPDEAAWAAYERRTRTEEILIGALANRELQWWALGMVPVDSGPWERKPGYNYNIELSLVWWHPRIHGTRRQFVRIYKRSFDEWLKTVSPTGIGAAEKLSPLERAQIWFQKETKENEHPRMSRDNYIEEMMRLFHGLSKRQALNQVWGRFAPAQWKKPGAKKGK